MTREEAIEQLENAMLLIMANGKDWLDERDLPVIEKAIEALKEYQDWMPCNERLPEEDVDVLVTDDAGGMATVERDSCGMYEDTGERFWYASQNVTAWKPLPEPYKGDKNE